MNGIASAVTARRLKRLAHELASGEPSEQTLQAASEAAGDAAVTLLELLAAEHRSPHAKRSGMIAKVSAEVGEVLADSLTRMMSAVIDYEKRNGSPATRAEGATDVARIPFSEQHRGVWKAGSEYKRDDLATWQGRLFYARNDNTGSKPGTPGSAWVELLNQ